MPSYLRKIIGAGLIIIGLLALVTPLTPGAWLILIGAEMLGVNLLYSRQIRAWYDRKRGKEKPPADAG